MTKERLFFEKEKPKKEHFNIEEESEKFEKAMKDKNIELVEVLRQKDLENELKI